MALLLGQQKRTFGFVIHALHLLDEEKRKSQFVLQTETVVSVTKTVGSCKENCDHTKWTDIVITDISLQRLVGPCDFQEMWLFWQLITIQSRLIKEERKCALLFGIYRTLQVPVYQWGNQIKLQGFLVCKRTVPTGWLPLVDFCGLRVSRGQRNWSPRPLISVL
jgi:hypothetical protein